MASHRKPRGGILAHSRRPAVGVTTVALASVGMLAQSAQAAPNDKPSLEEVKERVDTLYREAGTATQKYNAKKEQTDQQRTKVNKLLDKAAQRTEKLNDARRTLGNYATAQYRTGGVSGTATLLLTQDPQGFFKQSHLLDRMTGRQKEAVKDFQEQQRQTNRQRVEAGKSLKSLSEKQATLREDKQTVQGKLAEARKLLSKLTAEEKARLAAIERKKREEARRKAEQREREREKEREKEPPPQDVPDDGSYSAKARKVIDFAKKQLGKPYVWGATGPNSYDCSGLTLDAWSEAGVQLPRTTWDQVEVGTKVSKSSMLPGDLVFFYDDISHVGIYVGGGQMIHAPKPGTNIRYESIDYMPFHSAVRPA
ncbi:NlpC/P60 family protein [Streptomyces sp. NPDC005438]|uniref:C40 family peptidase n=1 Tax=Streptomyces sp. NPDC005438 TaxID=3156880 RepID=UPI0033BD4ED0